MTNEDVIEYILYDRLYQIISSIDIFKFEDGNIKVIEQLRQIYAVWIDETMEKLCCQDYLSDNPDNSLNKCESLLFEVIGKCMLYNRVNVNELYAMLSQMKVYMMNDKCNPFFKHKMITQKKQDIEQDFK